MPFKSAKQRRYLYSQKPEVAKKFAADSAKKGKILKLKGGGADMGDPGRAQERADRGYGSTKGVDRSAVGPGSTYQKNRDKLSKTTKTPPKTTVPDPKRPHYKPINIPAIGPVSYLAGKGLNYLGVKAYDYNKKTRDKFATKEGLFRDSYKVTGTKFETMDPKNKGYLKDAGYGPFQDKKESPGGDNKILCPDGSRPPCAPVSAPTALPQKKVEKKSDFLKGFQAYDEGGLTKTIPPLRGPNPQVPPVKLRKGKLTKSYKMSCPHRPDGIRGVGKAIRGHKFVGVR